MHRKGEMAERWARDHMRGHPTSNSGATFVNGDWHVDNRMYEFKSTEIHTGIRISRVDIDSLLIKASRNFRVGVFIFVDMKLNRYVVVPKFEGVNAVSEAIRLKSGDQFDAAREVVLAFAGQVPLLEMKGNSINVPETELQATNGFSRVRRRAGDVWYILPVHGWLRITGDCKS